MPQPLRKVRQRIPKTAIRPPRVLLHLPFLGVAALLVVFAVAVGWAFFMGVIIGQGQNPAERVSAMLHERPRETPPSETMTAGEAVADLLDRPLPLRNGSQGERAEAAAGHEGEDPARASDGQQAAPQAQEAQPASGQTVSGQAAQGRQRGEAVRGAVWQTASSHSYRPAGPSLPARRERGGPSASSVLSIYSLVWEGNARLSGRLMEMKMENQKLRQISADYPRVKRVFGPEQVEAAVEADKQWEQAEKGRKRPRHSPDRGGR